MILISGKLLIVNTAFKRNYYANTLDLALVVIYCLYFRLIGIYGVNEYLKSTHLSDITDKIYGNDD